ncbi:glycosyltransferase family 4 protein [Chryseobacterium sp. Y16C]|uniref:glycosyltransferase family 4 protein n=1 Tax=Chryseobacterium sp. Y16C TaxID=2920939 RepID=UPI001F0BCF00|nr:glycosyltransferase family 4 protein [Chryseobacterium sp. Y16C]UMQ43807.1 glycosyltransferase family 4 protein [Chryseobacterium sp. Y16C]
MEKHIYFLTKYQNESQQVSVFFNQGDKISLNDKKILPVVRLDKIKPSFIGIFAFYMSIIFSLLLYRKKFDVIHIHGDWSSLLFAKIIKRLTNAKIIAYTNHGLITNSLQHRILLPFTLKGIDLIFTTGYESAAKLRLAVRNQEVIVQPSGINSIFFDSPEKNIENEIFTVITVANLLPIKNISLIINIASQLPDIKFMIIGEGPEKESLQNKINHFKLTNIELCGFKAANEIKKLYNLSDCFLMTSLGEGTPTSILEALACGLPIVSSNAGGLNRVLENGKNGFIIEGYLITDYINAIKKIQNDKILRLKIKEENKTLARNYCWNNVEHNITNLIKRRLDEKINNIST